MILNNINVDKQGFQPCSLASTAGAYGVYIFNALAWFNLVSKNVLIM